MRYKQGVYTAKHGMRDPRYRKSTQGAGISAELGNARLPLHLGATMCNVCAFLVLLIIEVKQGGPVDWGVVHGSHWVQWHQLTSLSNHFIRAWLRAERGRTLTKTVYSEMLDLEIICRGGVHPSTDSKFIGGWSQIMKPNEDPEDFQRARLSSRLAL